MTFFKELNIQYKDSPPCKISLRNLNADDKKMIRTFLDQVPPNELIHFEENIRIPEITDHFFKPTETKQRITIIALLNHSLIAASSLSWMPNSRSEHVGEIFLYVLPQYRGYGLGFTMVKELYFCALKHNIEKLQGQIPKSSLTQFEKILDKLGFKLEAVLTDHIKNNLGQKDDLMIYGLNLARLWEQISDWQSPFGRIMEY